MAGMAGTALAAGLAAPAPAAEPFKRAGTAASYATMSGAREHTWGPAGDVVATHVTGTDPTFTTSRSSARCAGSTFRRT